MSHLGRFDRARGLTALLLAGIGACVQAPPPDGPGDAGDAGPTGDARGPDASRDAQPGQPCVDGERRCLFWDLQTCQGGTWSVLQPCGGSTPFCDPALGCTECPPGADWCDGSSVQQCDAAGQAGPVITTCSAAQQCAAGRCLDACEAAKSLPGYQGCEYFPTPTANPALMPAFDGNFGVAVHNGNAVEATATVSRLGVELVSQVIPPGELRTFLLPLDTGLKLVLGEERSVQVQGAAYRLVTTQPVTVYQLNPLDFSLPDVDGSCPEEPDGEGQCYSYSNDASLVLPAHVLGTSYLVLGRGTQALRMSDLEPWSSLPGFYTVVGTRPGTEVTVTSSAHTSAGDSVAAMSPGAIQTFHLEEGEAVQVVTAPLSGCPGTIVTNDCQQPDQGVACTYCDAGRDHDPTGTLIEASAPVAVFAGHTCALVPFDTWACDHLEEQLPPLPVWGRSFIVGRTEPQHDQGVPEEPNRLRLLSGADGNTVALVPPQVVDGVEVSLVALDAGTWVELEIHADLAIDSSGPLLVGQFLVGQNAYTHDMNRWGDPAFGLVVPVEQYRSSYTFLAPASIPMSYVNVTRRLEDDPVEVLLDGVPVPGSAFVAVAGTDYGVARLPIAGTAHRLESTRPIGAIVYGFARYTSYLYPAGLDLARLNPAP